VRQSYYSDELSSQFDLQYQTSYNNPTRSKFSPVALTVRATPTQSLYGTFRAEFDDDLDRHGMQRALGGWSVVVGRAGIAARGVILGIVGGALAKAGFDRRPGAAAGMTDAMWTLFAQPHGDWLLAMVAAGLICFGAFQLLHVRFARF